MTLAYYSFQVQRPFREPFLFLRVVLVPVIDSDHPLFCVVENGVNDLIRTTEFR
jgi:hypothetical protein